MVRTTITLPAELKRAAETEARRRGISPGEILRHSLEVELAGRREADPFFADDASYGGRVPRKLSVQLDDYLYGSQG